MHGGLWPWRRRPSIALRGRRRDRARRLTAQGLERKQQLLDSAAELFAERGYADTRVLDIVRHAGRGQGPLLLVLREQGSPVPRAGDPPPPGAAQGAGERDGPGGRAAAPHPPGRRGLDRHHVLQRALLRHARGREPERASPTCSAGATRSTWPTPCGSCRRASPTASIRDEDPVLLALGVVGAVAYYGHFHRTGRVDLPVAELAAFVGRYVVRALAADEAIAARVLRA